jgi:hypothetical protein
LLAGTADAENAENIENLENENKNSGLGLDSDEK